MANLWTIKLMRAKMKENNSKRKGSSNSKMKVNSNIRLASNIKLNNLVGGVVARGKRISGQNSTLKLKKIRSGNLPKKKSALHNRKEDGGARGRGKQLPKSPAKVIEAIRKGQNQSPTRRSSQANVQAETGEMKTTSVGAQNPKASSSTDFSKKSTKNRIPDEVRDHLASRGFTVVRFLDEGATAKVYEVVARDGRHLAAKVLLRAIGGTTEELTLLNSLKHPYITPVESIMNTAEYSIIVAELASEGDLITHIERLEKPNVSQSRIWFRQVSDAVAYLHDQGIAHRDIKADNVLLCKLGATQSKSRLNIDGHTSSMVVAKLTDFGAATLSIDPTTKKVIMCNSSRGGTYEYKAPECLGRVTLFDPFLSDVFSMGVLLYTLVTHEFPFGGNDEYRTEAGTEAVRARMLDKKWTVGEEIQKDAHLHSLLRQLLNPDTLERITARQALAHPWLNNNKETK